MHCGAFLCCTTELDNTHIPELREVLYSWHPWFGRSVHVFGVVDKLGEAVFRCNLTGRHSDRHLEVPVWMFDRATSAGCEQHKLAYVTTDVLMNLAQLLVDNAGQSGSPALSGPDLDSDAKIRSLAYAAQIEDDPIGAIPRTAGQCGCSNAALAEASARSSSEPDGNVGDIVLGTRRSIKW